MELQEIIIFSMEIVGTIAFAASGAMVGIEKSMDIFVRHVYASASILGAFLCAVLYPWIGLVEAMFLSAAAVVGMRYLAAHFRWNLPRVRLGEEEN